MKVSCAACVPGLVPATMIAVLTVVGCGGGSSNTPTSPTPSPTPPTPLPAPPPSLFSLTGRVLAGGGFAVRGATVTVLDGVNSGRSTTTDNAGAYRFDGLQGMGANFSARALGCLEDRRGIVIDGTRSLDFALQCDPIPVLLSPPNGATLDNGCRLEVSNPIVWTFDWSDVPGATAYHLLGTNPRATAPWVDNPNILVSEYERNTRGWILDSNARGFQWRVRARIGDTWGDWSVTRSFDLELEGTDCPPLISSISPSSPAASGNPQTIFLIGDNLVPGTVTATSPSGGTSTAQASQPSPNPFGLMLDQTVQTTIRLGEPGIWMLRLTDVFSHQSNTFTFTVR